MARAGEWNAMNSPCASYPANRTGAGKLLQLNPVQACRQARWHLIGVGRDGLGCQLTAPKSILYMFRNFVALTDKRRVVSGYADS